MEAEETISEDVNAEGLDQTSEEKTAQRENHLKCFYEADYLVFKGFCFFIYGAYGGCIPYLSLYFKQLFLGAGYVGIIVGIRPLIQCIGAPFWGIIADRYHAGKVIFLGSVIAWIAKALILLSVQPKSQYCIEVYTNRTANLTYVYAYDLWSSEAEAKPDWVVVAMSEPVLVEKNKIAVIEAVEIKGPSHESLPEQVLKERGPVSQETQSKDNEKDNDNESDSVPKNQTLRLVHATFHEKRRESISKKGHKKHGEKKKHVILTEPKTKVDKINESLRLKIVHKVNVHNKELNSPVEFITEVDKSEINFMFLLFTMIIIIGEFLESPTFALSDASVLKRLGEDRQYYGRIRMWGSLGWAFSAAMVGLLISSSTFKLCEVEQGNYTIPFYIFISFVAAAFVNAIWFRFTYEEEIQFEELGKLAPILANPRHLSFLLATLYTGFCYGILVHFVYWFIDDFGGSSAIMATAGAAREMSALISFGFSTYALKALGNVSMMSFCLLSYIICFTCYSILANPWMVVALEVLDGGTYGLVWSTCVSYMSKVGSELGVIESTQGILQGVFWGLGNGGGTMTSGAIIEMYGVISTFRYFAIAGAVVLVVFVVSQNAAAFLEQRRSYNHEYRMLSEDDEGCNKSCNDEGENTAK